MINLPYTTMIVVGLCALVSLIFGANYGTSSLFSRNIASILKGS
jgi:hypothetical protein